MASNKKAKIALTLALLLLCLSGLAAGFAIDRLYRAETQIRHTYDVEVAIGDVESTLTEVGRTRVAYVNSGSSADLKSFSDSVNKVPSGLAKMRQLTSDNSTQQALCDRFDESANERVATSQASVNLKQSGKSDPERQLHFTFEVAKTAFETGTIAQQMRRNEDALLEQRSQISQALFTAIPGILSVSFLLSAAMFWVHYRMLNQELSERREAENQLRQLSLELMRVQDDEHRRFARELHDGLGQTLAGAKMMVDAMATGSAGNPQAADLANVLGDALSQTRTISHLFHPPFLDEIGFTSAAKWLIEGYEQRMGVEVSANIPRPEERLPRNLEFTLYRVLQEALNNIQRHAKSSKAEVTVQTGTQWVTLRVKDDGLGIPSETMDSLRSGQSRSEKTTGVGLMGMRERVREQGGNMEIRSDGKGTEIIVRIPVTPN